MRSALRETNIFYFDKKTKTKKPEQNNDIMK